MILNDIRDNLLTVAQNNSTYNSDPWYLFISTRLSSYIKRRCRWRPLFPWIEKAPNPSTEAAEAVDTLLESNAYKYRHLWALYVAEYNPIWNYEGTEKETFTGATSGTKGNTGTQTLEYSGSKSVAKTGDDTNVKSGNKSIGITGDDTNVKSGNMTNVTTGDETNVKTGNETLGHGKTDTESATTYDSGTLLTRTQNAASGTDTTTYNSVQDKLTHNTTDTETYNSVQDKLTHNTTETETYNSVQDKLTHNTTETESFTNRKDTRTDNLSEASSGTSDYTKTIEKGGNMGVQTTQSMEEQEAAWIEKFNLLQQICTEICNEISYFDF